jgi:ATP-binding cassette, subfamily B, bacterial
MAFSTSKLTNGTRSVSKALNLLWRISPRYLSVAITALCIEGAVPSAIGYLSKLIIDGLVQGAATFNAMAILLAGEVVLVLLGSAAGFVGKFAEAALREKTNIYISETINTHASSLDLEFFENPKNFDSFTKAQAELGRGPVTLTFSLLLTLRDVFTVLAFLLLLLFYQPLFVLLLLLGIIPVFFAAQRSSFLSFSTHDLTTAEGRRAAYFEDVLTSEEQAKEVRIYNLAPRFLKENIHSMESVAKKRLTAERKNLFTFLGSDAFSSLIQYIPMFIVLLYAANGQVTIGDFVFMSLAIRTVRARLSNSLSSLSKVIESSLFFKNLDDFLSIQPNIRVPSLPLPIPKDIIQDIRFDNVTFAYPGASKNIYDGLSLNIPAHKTTAIVGANGSGKTTLVKLLLRLYDPQNGNVCIDGQRIKSYDPNEYRQIFGVLFQDFAKYQLSLKENIDLLSDSSSSARLESAVQQAHLSELLSQLPNGVNTMLGKQFHERGHELSGGQWQRVALARVLYKNSPIVILDEPTASLDAQTEYELFKEYRELAKGKTTIIITHRFNTISFVDNIIVFDAGKIIEQGTHDELMALEGKYYELFSIQAEAYLGTSTNYQTLPS